VTNVYQLMEKKPFEELVVRHGATVYRVCRALVGPSEADDAWSETFLSAMKAYPDLPADANTEAWLVRIAHHRAVDAVRSRARRPVPAANVGELGVGQRTDDMDDDVWAAVAALPIRQRQAVAYHYLGGRPYAEVAELIGGTPSAVRKASSDGIARLRARFADRTRGEP
jgi:RNA polymerase sigma factor (sigma-70 family)